MGRDYNGSILGKFWNGIQGSDDIGRLVTIDPYIKYCWLGCQCDADIENSIFCSVCFKTRAEHIYCITGNTDNTDNTDEKCLYIEMPYLIYDLDKSTHYQELIVNLNDLETKINKDIIEEYTKIEYRDDILDVFTGIFNNVIMILELIEDKEEKQCQSILVARYILGQQIEYSLNKTGNCIVNCEW
jgi:hypothetical protein